MNKNQRKNRKPKKEMSERDWDNQFGNLQRQFSYGDRKQQEEKEV